MTGPSIRLPGLPDFNAGDPAFKVTGFEGWYGTAKPRAELLPSGATHGAVAIGPWDFAEAYYTLSGVIRSTDRATLIDYRRALLAAFPADTDSTVVVLGNDEDVDLEVDVRRYDAPDIRIVANNLMFTFPLVAVDPFKYAATDLAGGMVAFTGADWFLTLIPQIETIDVNGSFEVDITGWSTYNGSTIAHDTTHQRSGSGCLAITRPDSGAGDVTRAWCDAFAVTEGATYTLSGYNTGQGNAEMRVYWYDSGDVEISSQAFGQAFSSGGYIHCTLEVVAPVGAATAQIEVAGISASVGHTDYADDITVFTDAVGYAIGFDETDYALTFETDTTDGLSQAAVLTSPGDVVSRRLTIEVTGPLDQGDWFLLNEDTGDRLWADVALTASQTITFDCYQQHATLNGSDIDADVFGDYLTLEPGTNTYRLVTGTDSAGFATVSAQPAYQ